MFSLLTDWLTLKYELDSCKVVLIERFTSYLTVLFILYIIYFSLERSESENNVILYSREEDLMWFIKPSYRP